MSTKESTASDALTIAQVVEAFGEAAVKSAARTGSKVGAKVRGMVIDEMFEVLLLTGVTNQFADKFAGDKRRSANAVSAK